MAERSLISRFLKEQITCAICYEILTEPVALPCQHVFCRECIGQWAQQHLRKRAKLKCPTCRALTDVENGDVSKLPLSFTHNSLLELYRAMKANETSQQQMPECASCTRHKQLVAFCVQCEGMVCCECMNQHTTAAALRKTHEATLFSEFKKEHMNKYVNNQLLCKVKFHEKCRFEYYCKTCKKCICQKCAITGHEGHDKVSIEEAAENAKEIIEKEKQKLKNLLLMYKKEDELSSENMQRIQAEIQSSKESVRKHTQEVIKIIQEQENTAIAHLDGILEEQKRINEEEKQKIKSVVENVTKLEQQCERMTDGKLQHFLLEGFENLQKVCETTLQNKTVLSSKTVKRNSTTHFIPNPDATTIVQDLKLGEVLESVTDPSRCSIKSVSKAICGCLRQFEIVTRNSKNKLCYTNKGSINVQIKDVADNDVANEVSEAKLGIFIVKYRAEKPSPYKAFVRIGGEEIQNSPQSINTVNSKAPFEPLKIINLKKWKYPTTLAVSDKEDIAVVSLDDKNSRHAFLFNSDGESLGEFGCRGTQEGKLQLPIGIVFNEDGLIISDNHDDVGCVKEYTMDCTYKRTLYKLTKGRFFLRFCRVNENIACTIWDENTNEIYIRVLNKRYYNYYHDIKLDVPEDVKKKQPLYIAYNNNKYFVTFFSSNRVCIFTDSGRLLKMFGETGSKQGQFDGLRGVTTFGHDMLLVCDANNHRVQVFNQDGQFISSFGSKGSGLGQLSGPIDIAVAQDGRVFVLECLKNRLQIWK